MRFGFHDRISEGFLKETYDYYVPKNQNQNCALLKSEKAMHRQSSLNKIIASSSKIRSHCSLREICYHPVEANISDFWLFYIQVHFYTINRILKMLFFL